MTFDENDIKVLKENFDLEMLNNINHDNVKKIMNYLLDNGIYYAKDLLLNSLDLFLLDSNLFIEKFEVLKKKLGRDYIDLLGNDISLIELMY